MEERFNDKLYEILATFNFNTERGEILEGVLRHFLVEKDVELDIKKKAKEAFDEINNDKNYIRDTNFDPTKIAESKEFKREWFKQRHLLLSNIPNEYVPEYLMQKFSPFLEDFVDVYKFDANTLWMFAFKLIEYCQFKKYMVKFRDEVYQFNSKEEFADLWFVGLPEKNYVEKWKNIITFDIRELKRIFSSISKNINAEFDSIIDVLSMRIEELPSKPEDIKLHLKPFLRLDDHTLVLLTPDYLTRALPVLYETLFSKCKSYLDSKGKTFERLTQETIKSLPFSSMGFNTKYGEDFETDAVIKFKKSAWVVEVTSHPPSLKALEGDWSHISDDLEKSIEKCIKQGERCIEHKNEDSLKSYFHNTTTNGILIVVDGSYPELNLNSAVKFFEEKYPVYIINWFDLRLLIDEPEVEDFEEFLLWRIIRPMPVVCFDEKDYWAFFFDNYKAKKEMYEGFEKMQEKELKLFYNSFRFNNKDYLNKIA